MAVRWGSLRGLGSVASLSAPLVVVLNQAIAADASILAREDGNPPWILGRAAEASTTSSGAPAETSNPRTDGKLNDKNMTKVMYISIGVFVVLVSCILGVYFLCRRRRRRRMGLGSIERKRPILRGNFNDSPRPDSSTLPALMAGTGGSNSSSRPPMPLTGSEALPRLEGAMGSPIRMDDVFLNLKGREQGLPRHGHMGRSKSNGSIITNSNGGREYVPSIPSIKYHQHSIRHMRSTSDPDYDEGPESRESHEQPHSPHGLTSPPYRSPSTSSSSMERIRLEKEKEEQAKAQSPSTTRGGPPRRPKRPEPSQGSQGSNNDFTSILIPSPFPSPTKGDFPIPASPLPTRYTSGSGGQQPFNCLTHSPNIGSGGAAEATGERNSGPNSNSNSQCHTPSPRKTSFSSHSSQLARAPSNSRISSPLGSPGLIPPRLPPPNIPPPPIPSLSPGRRRGSDATKSTTSNGNGNGINSRGANLSPTLLTAGYSPPQPFEPYQSPSALLAAAPSQQGILGSIPPIPFEASPPDSSFLSGRPSTRKLHKIPPQPQQLYLHSQKSSNSISMSNIGETLRRITPSPASMEVAIESAAKASGQILQAGSTAWSSMWEPDTSTSGDEAGDMGSGRRKKREKKSKRERKEEKEREKRDKKERKMSTASKHGYSGLGKEKDAVIG